MLKPQLEPRTGGSVSDSFDLASHPSLPLAQRSTLITTFLEDDEDVKCGRFAALFASINAGSAQNSKSMNVKGQLASIPTTTSVSRATGAERSHTHSRAHSLSSQTKSSSPGVSPARSARLALATFGRKKKRHSPPKVDRTRTPISEGRCASEPRPVSAGKTQRSIKQVPLHTLRSPLRHLGHNGTAAPKQKRQEYLHHYQPHHVEPSRYKKQKENRSLAVSNSLRVRGRSAIIAKPSAAPAVSGTTSLVPNSAKVVPRATSPTVSTTTKGKVSRQKGFIESFVLSDGDQWVGKSKDRRAQSAAPAPGKLTQATLSALPSKTMRQQLVEDVTEFTVKDAKHPDTLTSPPSVNLLQHASQPTEPKLPDKASSNLLDCTNNNNSINHSLHVWRVPPANVVLPEHDLEDYVWSAAVRNPEDAVSSDGWMRPLQERARTERRTEKSKTALVPGVATVHAPLREIDDDYHSPFHRGFQGGKEKGAKGHQPTLASAAAKRSERSDKVPYSLAAGSALLREPQYLLDSDALKSLDPISRLQTKKNENQWINVFASGSTYSPLQPAGQRFKFVALSYPAKVLYAAIVYLRTLGGLPTLLRINPLTEDCDVIGKEDCVELVFASDFPKSKDVGSRSGDQLNVKYQLPLGKRRVSVSSIDVQVEAWNKNSSMPIGVGSEELVVVIRSVIAEKSVVSRFGKTEIVHMLPPLENEPTALPDPNGATTAPTGGDAISNDALFRLLHGGEGSFGSVQARERLAAQDSRKTGKDYGDLAIAFLMSAEASQLTTVLPEPADLEAMRYKVFTLKQDNPDDITGRLKASSRHSQSVHYKQKQQREQEQKNKLPMSLSSFGVELMKMNGSKQIEPHHEDALLQSNEAMNPLGHLGQRFPSYCSVTIAESTLSNYCDGKSKTGSKSKKQTGKIKSDDVWELVDGCFASGFTKLRLPRFHADLVDSVRHVLHLHQQEGGDKAVRAGY